MRVIPPISSLAMNHQLLAVVVPFLTTQAAAQGLGTEFCLSEPNSTGSPSSLVATGDLDVQANDVTLTCSGLPAQQFGIYLFSFSPDRIVNPGGTGGVLCLGNPVGRDNQQIINTGPTGTATRSMNLMGLPQPNQQVAAQAGDTLHFQFWHRDVPTAGTVSNFSPGLRVQLQCAEVLLAEPIFGREGLWSGAFGDFDGDGSVDVAIVGRDPFLSIHLGDGLGEFGSGLPVAASGVGSHVLTVDADADGDLDIVAARTSMFGLTPALMLFRGDGQGGFALDSTRNLGGNPSDLVAADFNGDGWMDYALSGTQTFKFDLVTSAPGGGLSLRRSLFALTEAKNVVAEDFDGDGAVDLAFAEGNNFNSRVATYLNDGAGSFTFMSEAFGNSLRGLCSSDVDADGDPDLIAGSFAGTQIFENDGIGGLGSGAAIAPGWAFLCRDMDSDGIDDLVSLSSFPTHVTISSGNGVGGFMQSSRLRETRFIDLQDTADVNGDGHLDILAVGGGGFWTIIRGRGPTGLAPGPAGFPQPDLAPASARGDYDADGRMDFVWGHAAEIEIGYGDGTRDWPPTRTLRVSVTGTVERIESGDLDNDGDLDLVVTTENPDQLLVFENTGVAFASRPPLALTGGARDMALKDVNGDGTLDILLALSSSFGPYAAQVFSNTGGLSYSLTQSWQQTLSVSSIDAGDFDADGLTDIVFGNGVLKVVLGNAPTVVIEEGGFTVPWDLQVTDVDGDGRDEILSLHNASAPLVAVTKYNSAIGLDRAQEFSSPVSGEALELYDVEGDGSLDLIVGGSTSSVVCTLRGNGPTFEPWKAFRTGTDHEDVLPIDFDGDGITDLITISPTQERVAISWGKCR